MKNSTLKPHKVFLSDQEYQAICKQAENAGLRHWIISFGARDLISPIQAYYIAVEAARFYADRYQLVFAVHEDTDQVHVHFVMNQVSYVDGRKYSGTKKNTTISFIT